MNFFARTAEPSAAQLLLFSPTTPDRASALLHAAHLLLASIERDRLLDVRTLRAAMCQAFGASDAEGAWVWKDAYEACEAAQVLWLRQHGPMLRAKANAAGMLAELERLSGLVPTHTRRSEESQALQQFSTPLALGFVASLAAGIGPGDVVLEPSAGTGMLAAFAEIAGASLVLNELAETRAGLLACLFREVSISRHNAEQIDDRLSAAIRPNIVLMNPPFSASPEVEGRRPEAILRHIRSALARLAEGGRLVAITGANFSPYDPDWRRAFVQLQELGRVVYCAAIHGRVYAPHGTHVATCLTVIDRVPAENPETFPESTGEANSTAVLLDWVMRHVPERVRAGTPACLETGPVPPTATPAAEPRKPARAIQATSAPTPEPAAAAAPAPALRSVALSSALDASAAHELDYTCHTWAPSERGEITEALYEGYALQTIGISGAKPHPTRLVQSAAMGSVASPRPSYRPHLPAGLIEAGLLSDAQLESIVYAGDAHSGHLAGSWTVDDTFDVVSAAPEGGANAVRFRRGWFLGDGTGAGKGRQVAGIILDNWLKGRRRALWISKSDKLIEDARRDWEALGGAGAQVVALSRFKQGTAIGLAEGILFTTYATLRSEARQGGASRLRQITDWFGRAFDGVIAFDEAHALANAAGESSERGERAASQQGRAGLRLQHALPDARVLYVSATGATTVHNLAYAQRLGLWGGADFPFATRAEFVQAMEAGGIAAMEVLARDLKALGLYAARSLSYEGITYEIVEHALTEEQVRIYDAYAGAFQVIHNNLEKALEVTNITGSGESGGTRTYNAQAKSAARSAFESAKQRFFNHLISTMKVPTLIGAITQDLEAGHAAIVQIVSTGEALLDRRLSAIPAEEWGDVNVDITPREYVLDYLAHSFPTQLHELYSDEEGNVRSRAAFDEEGHPVQSRNAVARRDRMIEELAALPPVQGALDQIVQRFGTDQVAEVTGRSRRIVRKVDEDGRERLCVENRPGSANLAEAQAFQDDDKRILVFSDAGGTGRSYHADLGARNQRLRVHYLLEAGWKADTAIQGLGRSNRTNQKQPPLFRPVTTNVRGEKRFLSTIARRLDTLGAITRGQRQTGGQGLFRADDNLEGEHARAALRQFYQLVFAGKVAGCSLTRFQEATGLALTDRDGSIREELPPITTFLNRMLALPIAMQDALFGVFEDLLSARIEGAIAAGIYDRGVETVTAESLIITDRRTLYTHPASGAETRIFEVVRRDRNKPRTLNEALSLAVGSSSGLLVNAKSGRAAVKTAAAGLMRDDGSIEARIRLVRPMTRETIRLDALEDSQWEPASRDRFARAWDAELAELPEFSESTFHVVTGLLLPIWDRLPSDDGVRVYRLQTDDGERVIGRLVSAAQVSTVCRNLGLDDAPTLSVPEAWRAVLDEAATLHLTGGLTVRRTLAMGAPRIELCGFTEGAVDRLKAMGLVSEIISWRLRLFVPVGANGPAILDAVLARYPLVQVSARKAA